MTNEEIKAKITKIFEDRGFTIDSKMIDAIDEVVEFTDEIASKAFERGWQEERASQ